MTSTETREHPAPGLQLMHVADLNDYDKEERTPTEDLAEANVCTSYVAATYDPETPRSQVHRPVLDLDIPARLIPSSTPGHSHLYLDVDLDWPAYERLLVALMDAGILETGYVGASQERKHTAVRLPWVRKEDLPDEPKAPGPDVSLLRRQQDLRGRLSGMPRVTPPADDWEPAF